MSNNTGNIEILQIIESVAREKGLSKEVLISAIEQAVQAAGHKKYGGEYNIQAQVNRKTGEINLFRIFLVVDDVEDHSTQISLQDALLTQADAKIGDEIQEPLPSIDHVRVVAQAAKQVIIQRVSEAEREQQYNDFKDRKDEILNGIVKRIEYGNVIVDLGRAEAIIKKDQLMKGENFKVNDRVKAYVQDVRLEHSGPQIFLSRTDDRMLLKLMAAEVPEIYDNIIEIKAVSRDPGSKAKVAVYAADSSVDSVGACVGIKGNRIRAVTNELNGERIDVIPWSNNLPQFVINALAPAEIAKILIDEDKKRVEVVVEKDNESIAIGRRGQNVRLASKLTGWHIEVVTEEEESQRRKAEFNASTELFMQVLDVEEMIAQLLSVTGFSTLEQIANSDVESLSSIEGFAEDLAIEIKKRASDYVASKNEHIVQTLEKLGVAQELLDILLLPPEDILRLAEYGIKTIEDLGEITVKEFKTLAPNSNMSDENIELLIQTARTHVY